MKADMMSTGRIVFLLLAALLALSVTAIPATADYKPDAACDAITQGDVTKTDNPNCKPVRAIYINEDGTWIYSERLKGLPGENDASRLILVSPACKVIGKKATPEFTDCSDTDIRPGCWDTAGCTSSCGKAICSVCIGNPPRCGCTC